MSTLNFLCDNLCTEMIVTNVNKTHFYFFDFLICTYIFNVINKM